MQAAGQQTASNCGAVPDHRPVYSHQVQARAHSYVSGVQLYSRTVYSVQEWCTPAQLSAGRKIGETWARLSFSRVTVQWQ